MSGPTTIVVAGEIQRLLALLPLSLATKVAYMVDVDTYAEIHRELKSENGRAGADLDRVNLLVCGVPVIVKVSGETLFCTEGVHSG